jgi:hypothetical protein
MGKEGEGSKGGKNVRRKEGRMEGRKEGMVGERRASRQ